MFVFQSVLLTAGYITKHDVIRCGCVVQLKLTDENKMKTETKGKIVQNTLQLYNVI